MVSHTVVAAIAGSVLYIIATSLIFGITASCLIARKKRQKDSFTSAGVNPPVEQSSAADVEYDVPLDLPELRSQHNIDTQDNVAYVKRMSQA